MSSGAIAQLMGFITVPDMKRGNGNSSLLKFRLAFNRFDFGTRKSVTDFLTVTAFGKMADRIYSDIENNLNYICCFCDVRVSKYNSKTGVPVEHTEFIVNDCRVFAKPKSEAREHKAETCDGENVNGVRTRRDVESSSTNTSAGSSRSEKSEIQGQQGQMFQNWRDLPY
jgi:single-stranded DNA-binding protein